MKKIRVKADGQKTLFFLFAAFLFFSFPFLGSGCNKQALTAADVDTTWLLAKARDIIDSALADGEPLIRTNAIEVVAATEQLEFMPEVHQLLKDDFVPVRFAAAMAVGDMRYHPAEDTVRKLLKAPDKNTQIAAVYSLHRLSSSFNFEPVRNAITSRDQTLRANAAMLLGKNGDENDVKLLYWAMKADDSSDKVRFQAAEAIARLGDTKIYPKLWTMLISAYADDRIMGIHAMAALGTVKAQNSLITMLDDEVTEVRLAAAAQLGKMGEPLGETEVIEVLDSYLTDDMAPQDAERTKKLTALAIGQINTKKLRRFLPSLIDDGSKTVRIAAAKAVFQMRKSK